MIPIKRLNSCIGHYKIFENLPFPIKEILSKKESRNGSSVLFYIILYYIILGKEEVYYQILSHRVLDEIELRKRWQPGFRPERFRA